MNTRGLMLVNIPPFCQIISFKAKVFFCLEPFWVKNFEG